MSGLKVPRLYGAYASARGTRRQLALMAPMLLLSACGGSSSPGVAVNPPSEAQTTVATETGPYLSVVRIPNSTAAVALFPDGDAYYSPDGYNLGGGGATTMAYSGELQVTQIIAVGSGVEALLSDGSVYLSPDGTNLGGGGSTQVAYSGKSKVSALVAVSSGVDAWFSDSGTAYYSPDGLNLDGGGNTVAILSGGPAIQQLVPVGSGDGVVTLFASGTAFYSPDNRNIGGGGNTILATSSSKTQITRLVQVGGGVLAELNSGAVYLSPDGTHLDGGGNTVGVANWAAHGNAPFAARDSAHGALFLERLWVSGGYTVPTNNNSCFLTCSYFDLWSSTDQFGQAWNSTPSFATATVPNPRDIIPGVNNGLQDAPVPTDFYDSYSAVVVWNGQLTAIGSTVWRSPDGVAWQRVNQADGTAMPGPVTPQATENSRALILGSTLFFLQMDKGAVYSTTDPQAATWTSLGSISGFNTRCGSGAFVMNGRMWIVGGGACDYSHVFNDVWSSADGVTWTHDATTTQWPGRMWPCAATDGDGVAWLVGGYAPSDYNSVDGVITRRYAANHADLWYSKNGTDWKQLKADLGSALPDNGVFEPRHAPTCYVVGPETSLQLVIVAGTGGTDPNGGDARPINSIRSLTLPFAARLP